MSLEKEMTVINKTLNRIAEALENKKAPVDHEQLPPANSTTTREDVQQALVRLSKKYGKDPAKAILAKFDAKKIGDLNDGNYQSVINAVEDYFQQEVA